MKRKPQTCIYCRNIPGTTMDHVPPAQMFPDPKPSNLITVPACPKCNQSFQRDEDYFRALFPFIGARTERYTSEFWAKALRGLKRSPALEKTISDSLRSGKMMNTNGKEIGRWVKVEDNWERIVSLMRKLVLGLYFFETKIPLPTSVRIECPRCEEEVIDFASLYAVTRDGKRSWPGVFEYKYLLAASDSALSAWIFTFYTFNVYLAFSVQR